MTHIKSQNAIVSGLDFIRILIFFKIIVDAVSSLSDDTEMLIMSS